MIVVSDTSPLCYLLLIEGIEILPQLFERVIIPQKVRDELLAPNAPKVVREWISQPPDWLEVQTLLELDRRMNISIPIVKGINDNPSIVTPSRFVPTNQVFNGDSHSHNRASSI